MSFESFVNWLSGFVEGKKKLNVEEVCIILDRMKGMEAKLVSLRIFEAVLEAFVERNKDKWFYDKHLIHKLCWWFQFEHRRCDNRLKTDLELKLQIDALTDKHV